MNCNKYVKFLVWMGEVFAVWDAAVSRISELCRHILTSVSTSRCRQNLGRKHKNEETHGLRWEWFN